MSQFFDKAKGHMAVSPPRVQPYYVSWSVAPDKTVRVAARGLVKLSKRLVTLRKQVAEVERALLYLEKIKLQAQREIVPVKVCPPGASGRPSRVVTALPNVADLTPDQAKKLLAKLEARMKGA